MSLVRENDLFELAEKKGFAVPGFFPFNMDFIKIIIDVCEEERSPVVILQGPEFIESFGGEVFTSALKAAALNSTVPVALSVDHAFVTNEESKKKLYKDISLGWGSVMLDGSFLEYEENVKMTKEVAYFAQAAGVSCVGALGEVRRFFPQAMDFEGEFNSSFIVPTELMTDPVQAKQFVEETKVDSLAISVGQYVRSLWDGETPPFEKTARLDFQRIKDIRENVDTHLILHGGTHVFEDDLREAIRLGVSHIKVASEQALIWSYEIRKLLESSQELMFPEDIQKPALEAVKESMRSYIRLFNASNQI